MANAELRRSGRHAPGREGFTLFELLLVLAIVASLAALSWPQLTRILQRQGVQATAEQVRRVLDQARVRAVEEGRTLQVRFEPSGRRFVILPRDPIDPHESAAQSQTVDGRALPVRKPYRVYEISQGCTFYVRQELHQVERVAVERLDDPWLAHLENRLLAQDASWTAPILYFPDGSATDGVATVIDRDRRAIQLSVRGLTGTVSVSPLAYQPEFGDAKSN